ncbi:helix-turn-helix domain-containing protein [Paenibacillus sp. FSL F4-0122]|uniref:helix-turn-helix domain-containing protein n=1 Tax=Paenibacillus TaxID=44249 RepID=UPI00096E8229|nr:helix-turn-helix domain-containing protein [Paenibacillus odorifer]OME44219.1 DNA-directed RNA polymerase [Paenibacillus odorifer]OZQ77347.1 DNA-directed RNA polymerase [Paenibacillus odorifer]
MREVMELIELAQGGDRLAEEELISRYERLIFKHSWHNGHYSEDCKQQLIITFILAVRRFDINRYLS